MGGREMAISLTSQSMRQVEEQGIKIQHMSIGKPGKLYLAGNELHCLIPQKIVMVTDQGKLIQSSNLLAISQNEGKSWFS
jgi:hypothetical protein